MIYSPSEPDAAVTVRRNGAAVETGGTLTADGIYILTVTDNAKNARIYHLRIAPSGHWAPDRRLLVLAVPAVIALAVWLRRSRRLRVI